jgi:integrase
MGLGRYGDEKSAVSLARARDLAGEQRKLLDEGRDPIEARATANAAQLRADAEARHQTFRAAATSLVEIKRSGWRNEKHAAQWLATLEAYAFPVIGDLPVRDIGTDHVLRVLRPIWERIPETASRLRQRIEAVLDAAAVDGWRFGDNPARWKGHLAGKLPPPRKVRRVKHWPALRWHEISEFMSALGDREGIAAQALRFAILTASRSKEVRLMQWREVDWSARVWNVPAAHMKGGKRHRVALSSAAFFVLDQVRPLMGGPADLVFPSLRKHTALSDMTLSAVVRRMNETADGGPPRWRDAEGEPVVPHGFRSTFRDWAGETRPEGREVVEAALAHSIKDKAEAAYARSDLLEKRRALMDAWAEHCTKPPAGVVYISDRARLAAIQ